MDAKKFQKVLDEVLDALALVVNVRSFPFFPVLYASLFHFVRKGAAYRKAVRELPAGPRSRIVTNKSQRFIDDFLRRNAAQFASEPDPKSRKRAFVRLYPLLGLRDPFLSTLFRDELAAGDHERIVAELDERVRAAVDAIPAPASSPTFWKAMDAFVQTSAGLAIELVRERDVQELILDRVKRFLRAGKKRK